LRKLDLRIFLALAALVCVLSLPIPVRPLKGYSGDLIEAYFSDTPITADGFTSGTEWADFSALAFPSADGVGTNGFYIKYDANSLKLIASLYVWGDGTFNIGDTAYLYLDVEHDSGDKPDTDDCMFTVTRGGSIEDFGYDEAADSWDMNLNYPAEWEAYYMSVGSTWGATWIIPMTVRDDQRIGVAICQRDDRPPASIVSSYPSALHPLMPSTWAEVVFSKLDSSITVSASPTTTAYGEAKILSAMINQPVSRGAITVQYSKDGGVWTEIASGTPSDGRFSCMWIPPAVGLYNVRALWTGDIMCRASTSTSESTNVQKAGSATSTSLTASTITYNEDVTITGSITPALSDGFINIEYSPDKISWTQLDSSAPSEGSYEVSWTPQSAGTYYVRTSWSGTENYLNSTSPEQTLIVEKAPTSLQVSVSPESAQIDPVTYGGAEVEVSGSMSPALEGIEVTIACTRPDGTTAIVITGTTSAGEFTATLSVDQAGNWSISVSWEGNTNYLASGSSPVGLSIEEKTEERTEEIIGENWLPYIAGAAIIAIVVVVIALRTSAHALIGAIAAIAGAFRGATQKLNPKSIIGKRSKVSSVTRVRCQKCDGLNHETAVFCGYCGTRLTSQSA